MVDDDIHEFIKERDIALMNLDIDYARKNSPGLSDIVLFAAMHKARYELTSIPNELRHESAQYLRERGMGRWDLSELLPEGELPSGEE